MAIPDKDSVKEYRDKQMSHKERIRRKVVSDMGLNYDQLDPKAIEAFFSYTDKGEGKQESRLLTFWSWLAKLGPPEVILPAGDPRHKEYTKAQLDFSELYNSHCFREVK